MQDCCSAQAGVTARRQCGRDGDFFDSRCHQSSHVCVCKRVRVYSAFGEAKQKQSRRTGVAAKKQKQQNPVCLPPASHRPYKEKDRKCVWGAGKKKKRKNEIAVCNFWVREIIYTFLLFFFFLQAVVCSVCSVCFSNCFVRSVWERFVSTVAVRVCNTCVCKLCKQKCVFVRACAYC